MIYIKYTKTIWETASIAWYHFICPSSDVYNKKDKYLDIPKYL